MGQQLLRITKEAAYGVYPTSPAGSDVANIFLPVGDAFGVRTMPEMWEISDSGQGNRLIRSNVGRKSVGGPLSTYLFPSQSPLMLTLAAGLTGSGFCHNIPSFTCDHAIYEDEDCAVTYKRYVGCKFGNFSITCDDSGQGCLTSIKADIIGSVASDITSTEFPLPSLSAYPADDPFLFYHTAENAGQLTIGTARHDYKTLSIEINNVLKPFGGEARYNKRVGWFGRRVNFSTRLLYKGKADRDAYEAGTKRAVSVTFDDGARSLLLDFGSKNVMRTVGDGFPLDDYFTQTLGFTALVDPALSPPTDLTVTAAVAS